jgi:ABC-type polysaccharide/polyol phosphate export permease
MLDTFNLIVFLWQVSLVVSVISFCYGLFKRSWVSMLISFLTFLPIAYYFNGARNEWRLVALIPILVLIITTTFWWNQRNSHCYTGN